MLTPRQLEVYRFIRSYILKLGYSPTEKEVAEAIGIKSRGVAHRYINALVKAGYLDRIKGRRRNLTLKGSSVFDNILPVLGLITAGQPQELTDTDQRLDLSEILFQPDHFVYRVADNSLESNKINAGDFLICQRVKDDALGETIIAIIDGTLRLSRVDRCTEDSIEVENMFSSETQLYDRSLVHVLGKYKGLIRLRSAPVVVTDNVM